MVFDADGRRLGIYRKSHIPDGPGYQVQAGLFVVELLGNREKITASLHTDIVPLSSAPPGSKAAETRWSHGVLTAC